MGNEPGLQNDSVDVAEIQSCFSGTVIRIPGFGMNNLEKKIEENTVYLLSINTRGTKMNCVS